MQIKINPLSVPVAIQVLQGYKQDIAGGGSRAEYQSALDRLIAAAQPPHAHISPDAQHKVVRVSGAFRNGVPVQGLVPLPAEFVGASVLCTRLPDDAGPAPHPDLVDVLAQVIRQVDGKHDLGAAALAEAILGQMPGLSIGLHQAASREASRG